jgi:saccharopepsin
VLFGDNVLRSLYTVFDFGDYDSSGNIGNPYVKLLSIIDPNTASQDFASARGATARSSISYPTTSSPAGSSNQGTGADSTSVTVSNDVAQVLDTLGKYFPALAAIVALNSLVVLALLLLAIYWICTQRRKESKKRMSARPRSTLGRTTPRALTPMPMDDLGYAPPPGIHTYEPVSMAMSEDTVLVPPSPGYKYDPDAAKGFARPHSYAASSSSRFSTAGPHPTPIKIAHLADGPIPEDQPFTPPSPGFARTQSGATGDRPKSYA